MNSFGRLFRMTIFGESHGAGGGIGTGWLSGRLIAESGGF